MDRTSPLYASVTHILVLSLLCIVLFFFRMGSHALWDRDEGLHASTSKEMILSDNWITPAYNGENFYDKPALFNWFVAISFLIFGFTEFAARLPAAIFGWAGVITTYYLGCKMFNPKTGFFSAVILATSTEYIALSRVVVHDISLMFFITLALAFFYIGYQSENKRRLYFLLGYAALGFAALAKGPVGLLLPAMVIGLFLIFNKNIKFVKEMQLGWGFLLFMGIAAPWYILIGLQNPDYFEYFFIKQNFGSFLDDVHSRHPGPFYYYFPLLFGGFSPWSLFLPLVLYDAIRNKIKSHRDAILYILIWFAAIFIFFSLASSKLSSYILPVFPALSLLMGFFWHKLATKPTRGYQKAVLFSFTPAVIIFPATLIYFSYFPSPDLEIKFGFNLIHLKYLALMSSGISILAFFALLNRRYPMFLFIIAALMISVVVFAYQFVIPAIDPYRSTKNLAIKLDDILEPQENFLFYGREKPSALFYANRKATRLSYRQLRQLMKSSKTVYCIVSRDDWEEELAGGEKFAAIFIEDGKALVIRN